MKLLVTGGCGFLGSNLAAHGINEGYDVCILDNLQREGSRLNLEWLKQQEISIFFMQTFAIRMMWIESLRS